MLTATQLIRQAALVTGSIEVKEGRTIIYADPPLESIGDTVCWLCGGETNGQGLPTKKAIRDTFTDHSWARGQGSKSVCPGCAFCLSCKSLRNYSILATSTELCHPSRARWREILLDPPEPPFVCCLAVSGQKHISFKAPVSLNRDIFTVALEEQMVQVDPKRLAECLKVVEALYIYFTKEEIATARYSQHRIQQCGLAKWELLEQNLTEWRGSRTLELTLFVARKPDNPAEKPDPEVEASEPLPAAISGRKTKDSGPVQVGFDWI